MVNSRTQLQHFAPAMPLREEVQIGAAGVAARVQPLLAPDLRRGRCESGKVAAVRRQRRLFENDDVNIIGGWNGLAEGDS